MALLFWEEVKTIRRPFCIELRCHEIYNIHIYMSVYPAPQFRYPASRGLQGNYERYCFFEKNS
jgi:hypothetical protein